VVVADHAGSGKTLAYLLPFVQDIHEEEKTGGRATVAHCPRLVVMCPTEELAAQVAMTCRGIAQVSSAASRNAPCLVQGIESEW
jgi:ATP-dependent RNA helicase DDX18/HAS1